MRVIKYLLPAVFTACIACNATQNNESATQSSDLKRGEILTQDYGTCDSLHTAGACVNIALWLPSDSGAVAENLRRQMDKKTIERINEYGDSASIASNPGANSSAKLAAQVFIDNYNHFKKDFPDAPGYWFVKLKGDTLMVTPKVMLYQLDHFAFTGGAHPNSFRSYHIFDAATGDERDESFFIADSLALLKKTEAAFRKLEKLDDTVNLETKGYFLPDHQFFLPANYTFTKEGILFCYNPYEIAAYARGRIQFTIPYQELDGVVKKDLLF